MVPCSAAELLIALQLLIRTFVAVSFAVCHSLMLALPRARTVQEQQILLFREQVLDLCAVR
jgi:hypothetical protein